MLRALSILNANALTSALPAVQQVLGVAQQCCYATKKQASYVEDATKAKAKKEKSTKATKAPSKRTPSAYNLFVKEMSASISSGTAADRVKRLAQDWKTLPAADKAPYESQAAALKEEHAQAQPVKPKRAPSAYNMYFKEQYAQLGGTLKVTEAAKKIGALWKSLPESEKQRYKAAAEAGK